MTDLGADPARIVAAVGPCIAQRSYEVGADLREQFTAPDERFFVPGAEDRWQFDLPGYVAHRLAESGVRRIDVMGRDTYAEAEAFYSFRRASHRGEPTYGRLLSLIGLNPAAGA